MQAANDEAADHTREAGAGIGRHVSEQPLATILVVGLAGFLAGWVARRTEGSFTHGVFHPRKAGSEMNVDVIRDPPPGCEGALSHPDPCISGPQAEGARNCLSDRPPGSAADNRDIGLPAGMLVGLVHELNNLMTVIGFSMQLAVVQPSREKQAAELARANWGIERAKHLTERILCFARNPVVTSQPAELSQLVGDLETPIAYTVGREIELRLERASDPLPVHVDAAQFELALLNLVRNAADAMPDGGTLTIRATGFRLPQYVAVTVADTGEGMTSDTLKRATEPFFTTKAKGSGSGLGLSFVRHFAETAGGWLEIDSSPGCGTRITMVLPRDSGDA